MKAADRFPMPVEQRQFPRPKTRLTKIFDVTFDIIRKNEAQ